MKFYFCLFNGLKPGEPQVKKVFENKKYSGFFECFFKKVFFSNVWALVVGPWISA